jgi:hypothetical protein
MRTLEVLTPEKLQEIYTNEAFRNKVAYAHGCYTAFPNSVFKHFKTCGYPDEYIVTQEQIDEAAIELERAKIELDAKYNNKLVFIGMGMEYEPRFEGDVCNHRVRTELINKNGHKYFIELGTGRKEEMRCDHSIDYVNGDEDSKKYNFGDLERKDSMPKYTLENVLSLVNRVFDCKFTEIIIDNHTLSTDHISVSPK